MKIIDGVKKIWKGAVTALTTAAATVAVMMSVHSPEIAQDRLDDAHQMYIAPDSTMEITAVRDSAGAVIRRDTVMRATNPDVDLKLKLQQWGNQVYADGYTQFIVTIETVNLLTGADSVHYIIASTPQIGTNVVISIDEGAAELATEKIPERLNSLPLEKAQALGYVCSYDSVKKANQWTKALVENVEAVKE